MWAISSAVLQLKVVPLASLGEAGELLPLLPLPPLLPVSDPQSLQTGLALHSLPQTKAVLTKPGPCPLILT